MTEDMNTKDLDLMTHYCQSGFKGEEIDPHIYSSSPVGMAYYAGVFCKNNRYGQPLKASMSRGYNVRVKTSLGTLIVNVENPRNPYMVSFQ